MSEAAGADAAGAVDEGGPGAAPGGGAGGYLTHKQVMIVLPGLLLTMTLAMLDQQETVKTWWKALPGYIEKVQEVLGQVEHTVAEVSAQRERLHRILTK